MTVLNPEHLDHLRGSGLTDATITSATITSVPPDRLAEALGFHHPQVKSAYGIPYRDEEGLTFLTRYRIFPPVKTKDGRTMKYVHPKGVPALPYITPEVWALKSKANRPLWLTEGEK